MIPVRRLGLAVVVAAALGTPVVAAAPGPAAPMTPAVGVSDPALALLVGIIDADRYGSFPRPRIRRELDRLGRASKVPLESFRSFERVIPTDGAGVHVRVAFGEKGVIRIPYDILGYHPGKLRTSGFLELEEFDLGTIRIDGGSGRGRGYRVLTLEDVRVWGVRRGSVEMDVDGWLDALLGSRLDDSVITGFALYRFNGKRIAMALGYSKGGRGHSGAFDLAKDEILFPYPAEYKAAGRWLRNRMERLVPEARRLRPRQG